MRTKPATRAGHTSRLYEVSHSNLNLEKSVGPLYPKSYRTGTGGIGTRLYVYRDGYVQKMKKPMLFSPVYSELGEIYDQSSSYGYPWISSPATYSNLGGLYVTNGIPMIDNRCYGRMMKLIKSDTASLGILLGEHNSSRRMIRERAEQLVRFATAVAKRDLKGLVNSLPEISTWHNRKTGAKHWSIEGKTIAQLWLEYSWGWRPAIEDIYNGIDVLVSPVSSRHLVASAHGTDTYVLWDFSDSSLFFRRESRILDIAELNYVVKWGVKVDVENENIALANRLGLINPIGIAWSVMPFSFLVDKVVNIGQVLNSITDLYGFQVSESWIMRSVAGASKGLFYSREWDSSGIFTYDDSRKATSRFNAISRQYGQLSPIPAFRYPSVGSMSEVGSLIALVIQLMSKK